MIFFIKKNCNCSYGNDDEFLKIYLVTYLVFGIFFNLLNLRILILIKNIYVITLSSLFYKKFNKLRCIWFVL
jgi:hypothetical protein